MVAHRKSAPRDKPAAEHKPAADDAEELNKSLDDMLLLMAAELERLQAALEFYRLGERPDKEALIRWHVEQIDLRQDRMEELKALILASRGGVEH